MQPVSSEQKALTAARLLARLPAKDLNSIATQAWLCEELARLSEAGAAALYWPARESSAEELWGKPPGDDLRYRFLVEAGRQALESGQGSWVEEELGLVPARRAGPGKFACLPFGSPGRRQGVLLLWAQPADIQAEMQELLRITGGCIADLRENSRQLSQSREACAELELRRAELLHSRNTLRALFDNTPTAMYIISSEYSLLAVNRCRADLAGQKPQRLVGRRCFEALFGRRSPCPDCLVGESLAAGRNTRRISGRTTAREPEAILEIATFPVQEASGQAGQAIIFEEDVTSRRRLEASLAQAEKLAAVGQLAAGVAHEINNPLTAVIANAQLLQRGWAGQDDETSEMVSSILQAGKRALQVVHQLLDLSRPGECGLLLTDINANLQQAFSILQPELRVRSIRLETDLAANLPLLLVDPDQLQGVWINLLVNAMHALQNGQGEIRVCTRQRASAVEVRVEDNGTGIPPERLALIFEPFYTTKDPGSGTGLGLSISYRVIKEHSGEIRVESQPGLGTTFTVLLPVPSPS